MGSIQSVPAREMERMMKVQEVILKAMAGSLKWWEAAEIIGVSDRTMRRWRTRYQEHGYDGLYDYRKGQPSPKRILVGTLEQAAAIINASAQFFLMISPSASRAEARAGSSWY